MRLVRNPMELIREPNVRRWDLWKGFQIGHTSGRDEALRRVEVEEREEEALRDEVVVDVLRRLDRMDLLDRLRALYKQ